MATAELTSTLKVRTILASVSEHPHVTGFVVPNHDVLVFHLDEHLLGWYAAWAMTALAVHGLTMSCCYQLKI